MKNVTLTQIKLIITIFGVVPFLSLFFININAREFIQTGTGQVVMGGYFLLYIVCMTFKENVRPKKRQRGRR